MTDKHFKAFQSRIETHLRRIEVIVGPGYNLTLVARWTIPDGKDADIVLTRDELPAVIATIEKMKDRPVL